MKIPLVTIFLIFPVSSSFAFVPFTSCTTKHGLAPACKAIISTHLHQEKEQKYIEWGVSYIGGDPCGSKYNDDPFDNKPSKPGFPDDMKARIEAIVERKRKEAEELEKATGDEGAPLEN